MPSNFLKSPAWQLEKAAHFFGDMPATVPGAEMPDQIQISSALNSSNSHTSGLQFKY
jgi:hypothetical protein